MLFHLGAPLYGSLHFNNWYDSITGNVKIVCWYTVFICKTLVSPASSSNVNNVNLKTHSLNSQQ